MSATTLSRTRYDEAVARFRIEDAIAGLRGDLETGLNACVECCDRHCGANRVALRCLSPDEALTEYTFEDLRGMAARAANLMRDKGIRPGDVVAGLLPRTVELVAVVLGAWRLGAVYQPLFTAFGPKAIEHRLRTSGAKLVVTNAAQRPKLDEVEDCPLVAVLRGDGPLAPGDVDFREALAMASETTSRRCTRLPACFTSRAVKGGLSATRSASTDQYSCGRKRSISSSRSTTSRRATDCTRPAERAPGSLRHSTGERVKPTR